MLHYKSHTLLCSYVSYVNEVLISYSQVIFPCYKANESAEFNGTHPCALPKLQLGAELSTKPFPMERANSCIFLKSEDFVNIKST